MDTHPIMLTAFASGRRMKFPDVPTSVRVLTTFPELLYNVRNGTCDYAASSITHTGYRGQCKVCPEPEPGQQVNNTHACCIDFTKHYYRDAMSMVMRSEQSQEIFMRVLHQFWQPALIKGLCALVVSLLVSGHLMWWFERRKNKQFPYSYLDGVDDGIWWSFVTMTTVGYGDTVPKTILGRLIACVWMIIGIVLFGIFNASILTAMMVPRLSVKLSGPDDWRLSNASICSTFGAFEEYLPDFNFHDVQYERTMNECYEKLRDHEVDAVFYDRLAILQSLDDRVCGDDCTLLDIPSGVEVSRSFQSADFAVAMPLNGTLNPLISEAVDELTREGAHAAVVYGTELRSMKFGFTVEAAAAFWTTGMHGLDASHAYQTVPWTSKELWRQSYIWIGCTMGVTLVYVLGQFGGLWFRLLKEKHKFSKSVFFDYSLKRKEMSMSESGATGQLVNAIGRLQQDVTSMKRASRENSRRNKMLGADVEDSACMSSSYSSDDHEESGLEARMLPVKTNAKTTERDGNLLPAVTDTWHEEADLLEAGALQEQRQQAVSGGTAARDWQSRSQPPPLPNAADPP